MMLHVAVPQWFFVPPVSRITSVLRSRPETQPRPEIDFVFEHALTDGLHVGEIEHGSIDKAALPIAEPRH